MAKLTQPDRDNYKKLKTIVERLRPKVTDDTLKALFNRLLPSTDLPNELNTIQALESILDKIDAYLGTQNLLLPSPPDAIATATQELLEHSALIKESLQDVTDAYLSTLDDLGSPCTDAQFLELIPAIPGNSKDSPKTWTKRLLVGHSFELSSTDIIKLTDAWGISIAGIVEDAQNQALPLSPGTPDTIARFFCIHEELEDLYDKVSDLVA